MPRPENLSVSFLAPATLTFDSDDGMFAAIDAVDADRASWTAVYGIPAAALPLLVLRPNLLGLRPLAEATACLDALVAWSAVHREWLVVGTTLEWETNTVIRKVVPVVRAGEILQILVAAGPRDTIAAELGPQRGLVTTTGLALATVDEVAVAVEIDPAGKGLANYFKQGGGDGVDVHVVLRSTSELEGVPRGNIARDGGLVVVCAAKPSVAKIRRDEPLTPPDLYPNVRMPRMQRVAGEFIKLDDLALRLFNRAISLEPEAPAGPVTGELRASTAAAGGLGGAAAEAHAQDGDAFDKTLAQPLPPLDGMFRPTQAELDGVKSSSDTVPAALSPELLAYTQDALSVLPEEHLHGIHLNMVFRNKGWGGKASFYTSGPNNITINIPFQCKWAYERLHLDDADWMWMAGQGRFGTQSCWGRSSADRELPRLKDQFVLRHSIRHEVGHAVAAGIGFGYKCAHLEQFGGWRTYQDDTAFVGDMLIGAAKDKNLVIHVVDEPAEGQVSVTGTFGEASAAGTIFAGLVGAAADTTGRQATRLLDQIVKKKGAFWQQVAAKTAAHQAAVEQVCRALVAARKKPYWEENGGGVVIDGRGYHYDQYDDAQSYLASARARRLSNYQFTCSGEFFAELYAFYFATPEDPGRLLREAGDTANAAWFTENLGPGGHLIGVDGLRKLP